MWPIHSPSLRLSSISALDIACSVFWHVCCAWTAKVQKDTDGEAVWLALAFTLPWGCSAGIASSGLCMAHIEIHFVLERRCLLFSSCVVAFLNTFKAKLSEMFESHVLLLDVLWCNRVKSSLGNTSPLNNNSVLESVYMTPYSTKTGKLFMSFGGLKFFLKTIVMSI